MCVKRGGIVADSVPQNEWIETRNKAKALLRAAEMAEGGLEQGGVKVKREGRILAERISRG